MIIKNYRIILLFVLFNPHLIQPIFAALCRKNEECSKEQYCNITGLGRCVECRDICNVNTYAMKKQCERVCPGYTQAQANREGTTTAPGTIPSVAKDVANRAGTTTAPWVIPSVATAKANRVGTCTTMAPEVTAGLISGAVIIVTLFITVAPLVYYLVIKKGKRPRKRYHKDKAKRKDSQDLEVSVKMLNKSESTSEIPPADSPPMTNNSNNCLSTDPMQQSSLQSDQEAQSSTGGDPDDMVLKQSADPESHQVTTIHEENRTATLWTLGDLAASSTTTDSGFPLN